MELSNAGHATNHPPRTFHSVQTTCIPEGNPRTTCNVIFGQVRIDASLNGELAAIADASNPGEVLPLRIPFPIPFIVILSLAFAVCGQNAPGQNTQPQPPQATETSQPPAQPQQRSPGGDVGSGAGDVGKGTAKGAGAALLSTPSTPSAMLERVQPSPARTSALVPPREQAKLPNAQVGVLAGYSTIVITRRRPRLHPHHKTKQRVRQEVGGHAALGLNLGYHRLKSPSSSSLRTLVRAWSRRCAPRRVHCICCFLTE